MKIKRIFAAFIAIIMISSTMTVYPQASDEDWIYIDGENIVRELNMAVIYSNVESTNQNQWGHDIVIDADSKVTEIFESGNLDGRDLTIPEGGAVISAGGTKVEWFEDNIDVGDTVYYDRYTHRLFVCDSEGGFDPYFEKTFYVEGSEGSYTLANPEVGSVIQYTYDIAVDANGKVVARDGGLSAPEGGFVLSAATNADRSTLLMYAPLGAECIIEDGIATFRFDEDMLQASAEIAIAAAESKYSELRTEFDDIDYAAFEETIESAKETAEDELDYKTLSDLLYTLEYGIEAICSENVIGELRGAFYTPDETNATEVRATVLAAKAAGLNTIILRVTNGYRTFIPLPEGNKFQQDSKFGGFDVLASFIEVCRQENVGLSLCIDTYYNEYASVAAPEWLSQSNGDGGLANKYYSPASAEFKAYFLEYVDYIVSNYDIDHLMFDYLRYPKFVSTADLGYDYNTMQLFSTSYEIPINEIEAIKTELFESPHWEKWVEFKTGLINDMAKSISESVIAKKSDVTITAVASRETIDHYYMQDAAGWIENGWFEGLCLAFYEGDSDENDPLPENGYYDGMISDKGSAFATYTGKDAFFFTGLESDSYLSAFDLNNAIEDSRALGADGFIFSDLDGYIARNYASYLGEGALGGKSVSPFIDEAEAMTDILEYSKIKINGTIVTLGGCEEDIVTQANTVINKALEELEDGAFTVERAEKLENDIALIFASAPAKAKIMIEYEVISKLARLAKEDIVSEPPVNEPSDESSVPEDEPGETSDESQTASGNAGNESEAVSQDEGKINIDVGNILIYGFVGVTCLAVFAAMIVGIRRKNQKDPNHHMPKGSAEGYEDKNGDE